MMAFWSYDGYVHVHTRVSFVRDSLQDGASRLLCSAQSICLADETPLSWEAAPGTVTRAGGVLKNRAFAFIILFYFFFFIYRPYKSRRSLGR